MNVKQILVISAAGILVLGVWLSYGPPISVGGEDDKSAEELLDELVEAAEASEGPIEVKVVYRLNWPTMLLIGIVTFSLAAALAYMLRNR
jgi:hypothetical protein